MGGGATMILVAGGTGVLGGRVVHRLLSLGHSVRVMSRNPESDHGAELRSRGAEVVEGDLCNRASIKSALAGVDTLVVSVQALAGPGTSRTNNPHTCDDVGVHALLEEAKNARVRHVVYVSIAGASPDAGPEFVRIKYETERAVRESGMTWTIIRPAAFMEVWSKIIGAPVIEGQAAMVFGDGNNPVNFVSADDVAEFVVLAAVDPAAQGLTLTVGGPENLTLNDVVDLFAQAADHPAKVRRMPVGVMKTMGAVISPFNPGLSRQMGMGAWMATSDQRIDMTTTLQRFPVQLTRMQEVARLMASEERVRAMA